ncbi:hypothetical protein ACFW4X_10695 [Streptomyces smyrnaeus]|uniref:hypothetical protein n=1 Tax=Streptomyces smyrnaeus TaxID=1387713 RepID=UPI003692B868
MNDDGKPRESVSRGYEDVAAHFRAHQYDERHPLKKRGHRAYGGVPAFLVPSKDGGARRVSCCICIRGSEGGKASDPPPATT